MNNRIQPRVGMKVRSVRMGHEHCGILPHGGTATITALGQVSCGVRDLILAHADNCPVWFSLAEWEAGDIVLVDEPGALRVGECVAFPSQIGFLPLPIPIVLAPYRDKLARPLFDEELWEEARRITDPTIVSVHEQDGLTVIDRTHPSLQAIRRTLDIMWDRTKPATRRAAERKADRLTDHMRARQ